MKEHEEKVQFTIEERLLLKKLSEKAAAQDAAEKRQRGRPNESLLAGKIARWMRGFCATFKGSNGAMYVRVEHPKYPEYSRMVPLTDVPRTDATLHELIGKMYEKETGNLIKLTILESACSMFLISTKADASTIETAVRVAHTGTGSFTTIYIDRGTESEDDRYIRVTRDNVSIGNDSGGFYFIREGNTGELPLPDLSSTYSVLPPLLTLNEEDKKVIFLWCMQTLLPLNAYVNCAIDAQSGSGKSTLVAYLRGITDPYKEFFTEAGLPEKPIDFMVKGTRTHILSYDNIEEMPRWFNENACRVSRGTEMSAKTLYTNTGLTEIRTKNPLIFSGINLIRHMKSDLIRRSLMLKLSARPQNSNSTEALLKRQFDAIYPQLLGALLNAVRGALVHIDELREDYLGNMPEFRRWSIAAGVELEWTEAEIDELLNKYQDPKRDSDPLNGSGFLNLVVLFLKQQEDYEYWGTPEWLLHELRMIWKQAAGDTMYLPPDFPADGTRCAKALGNARSILATQDIIVKLNTDHTLAGNRLFIKLVVPPEEAAVDNFVRSTQANKN